MYLSVVVDGCCVDGCSRCLAIVAATLMVVGTIVSGVVDATCRVALDTKVCC